MKKRLLYLVILMLLGIGSWLVLTSGQALKSYQLVGDLDQVNRDLLDPIVEPYLSQSFWQVDLAKLHAEIKRLDWVYRVGVKRRWPDQLVIELVEQTPVVRWGETAFLNQQGQIFYPKNLEAEVPNYRQFVMLNGADVQSQTLLSQFVALQGQLEAVGWQIDRMDALADGVWKVHFTSGITLLMAQDNWQDKLTLFLKALPKVSADLRKFAQTFDLRYSNGFVIEKANPPEFPHSLEQNNSPETSVSTLDKVN